MERRRVLPEHRINFGQDHNPCAFGKSEQLDIWNKKLEREQKEGSPRI